MMIALLHIKKHNMPEHRLNILIVRFIYTEEVKRRISIMVHEGTSAKASELFMLKN